MQLNTLFSINNLKTYFQYPLRALISRSFYFHILFCQRGLGIFYLLCISIVLSVPASYQVAGILKYFRGLEISSLVSQIPASYLNSQGLLSPNDNSENFKILRNSKNQPAIVYNTENRTLSDDALAAPIELKSDAFIIKSAKGVSSIPYIAIFETDSNFKPYESAVAIEEALSAPMITVWLMVSLWFYSILLFTACVAGLIAKFFMLYISKIRVYLSSAIRLCSFGSTLAGVILLVQFFFYVPINFSILVIIPLAYVVMFCHEFRKELARIGLEAFKHKYVPFAEQNEAFEKEQERRRSSIDELTGRNAPDFSNQNTAHDNSQNSENNAPENKAAQENSISNDDNQPKQNEHNNDSDKPSGPGYFAP